MLLIHVDSILKDTNNTTKNFIRKTSNQNIAKVKNS